MDISANQFEKIVLPPEHENAIESIGAEVNERHVDYIGKGIIKERKDVFKEVLGERVSAGQVGQAQPVVAAVSATDEKAEKMKRLRQSQQLQELVNFAATKGPVEASILVSKIGDPWLEDQFHDTLIKFHDELVRRKKLKGE